MSENIWHTHWRDATTDPYQRLVLTLLLLNGLTIEQIRQLPHAEIDRVHGWITVGDGDTYPLVEQARDVLTGLNEIDPTQLAEAVAPLAGHEAEAHRRLCGAIWITDEALQLTLETAGTYDAPILPRRFTFPFSIVGRLQPGEVSPVAQQARETLQQAADWLVAQTLTPNVPLAQRVLGLLRQGSLVFLVASTGVSGLNLIHNVIMGRLLSPADYSQLTFIITLQLLIGLLPTALQTVVARFAARYEAHDNDVMLAALRRETGRFGWLTGVIVGILLVLTAPLMVSVFRLDHVGLMLPVALAVPFFIRMGTDRGVLQGGGAYFWLSGAYITEGVIRLGVGGVLGYALVSVGRALEGAIWGVAQSMLLTWFVSWLALRHFRDRGATTANTDTARQDWTKLGGLTALVLIGQALITNSDFLLVKNFFSPEEAGFYAAISVLGRIVYFGALPLTVLLVPLVARRQALDEPTRPILLLLIGGGIVVCSGLIVIAAIFAPDVLGLLYGDDYVPAADLLAPYALAASLYTLTNLVITYQIALGNGGETGLPILAGTLQVVAVFIFHESLSQVVTIQIVLMGGLFSAVAWRVLRGSEAAE